MEGLERLVTESFARHGVETQFDHRRVQWSPWFRCADSFSLVVVSSKPGLFALADEVVSPGESAATGGKRMLGLFRISEADDLGMALGRLFLPHAPERERLAGGRCFARYAVIEDPNQRHAAYAALHAWSEAATGVSSDLRTENLEPETGFQTSFSLKTDLLSPTEYPSGAVVNQGVP
jgi:hypothetical protein